MFVCQVTSSVNVLLLYMFVCQVTSSMNVLLLYMFVCQVTSSVNVLLLYMFVCQVTSSVNVLLLYMFVCQVTSSVNVLLLYMFVCQVTSSANVLLLYTFVCQVTSSVNVLPAQLSTRLLQDGRHEELELLVKEKEQQQKIEMEAVEAELLAEQAEHEKCITERADEEHVQRVAQLHGDILGKVSGRSVRKGTALSLSHCLDLPLPPGPLRGEASLNMFNPLNESSPSCHFFPLSAVHL